MHVILLNYKNPSDESERAVQQQQQHLLTQLHSFLAKKSRENYITSNMIFFLLSNFAKNLVIDENKTPINKKKSAVEFGGNLINEVFFSFLHSLRFVPNSHSGPENLKKSRQKKIVKSNK